MEKFYRLESDFDPAVFNTLLNQKIEPPTIKVGDVITTGDIVLTSYRDRNGQLKPMLGIDVAPQGHGIYHTTGLSKFLNEENLDAFRWPKTKRDFARLLAHRHFEVVSIEAHTSDDKGQTLPRETSFWYANKIVLREV